MDIHWNSVIFVHSGNNQYPHRFCLGGGLGTGLCHLLLGPCGVGCSWYTFVVGDIALVVVVLKEDSASMGKTGVEVVGSLAMESN